MKNKTKILLLAAIVCAYGVVGAMDYQDDIIMANDCKELKAQGIYPKGYNCE